MSKIVRLQGTELGYRLAQDISDSYDEAMACYCEDYPEETANMLLYSQQAIASIYRYRCLGGDLKYLLRVIGYDCALVRMRSELSISMLSIQDEIEHVGSSPVDTLHVQQALQSLLAMETQLFRYCNKVIAENLCEDLAEAQDEAQDAFDWAYEQFTFFQCGDVEVSVAAYYTLNAEMAEVQNMLKKVCKRLEAGEVPSRDYPLSPERWNKITRSLKAVQTLRTQLESRQGLHVQDDLLNAQLESTAQCMFMLTALFNVRRSLGVRVNDQA